ncbi:MAG: hypothetical protein BWY69_00218 [Planctomycetes bacterium ADurb.Bin401]|nr:MAG: hypothetical protein BWY69_00218 [Planctomycetes bacterium ADurb.Bin401]
MFSNTSSYQAKIVDFISIGGTAAIGHSFEPIADATIDTEFLFYNLMADYDSDGYADMTFIEAAFTAIPYISWTEVVIGDPLMRIAYGTGGEAEHLEPGDVDGSGQVDIADVYAWMNYYLGALNSEQQSSFEEYHDLCDLNSDGNINFSDFAAFFESY